MIAVSNAARWASYLLEAEAARSAVAPITDSEPHLGVEDAYAILDEQLSRRLERGEQVVGAKIGLTSRAKQEQMGVREPIFAWLTDAMMLAAEEPVVLSELIHPRCEPEIVFVVREALEGPGITAADVLDASTVGCGLEIIDSRYADFRFTLADVIADNASSARFTLGAVQRTPDFDLTVTGCLFEDGAELVATAAGAAILGNPAEAVALLANHLGRRGRRLEAGWIVLAGALCNAVPLHDGSHVTATFGHLGRAGVRAVA